MFAWIRQREAKRVGKRIFYTPGHERTFARRQAIAKTEYYVRWIHSLSNAINTGNKGETRRRQHYLKHEGIKPPHTMIDCEKLIQDLRLWREL